MDQQQKSSSSKSRNTILKYLPRATSSVSFQHPQIYSPSIDKQSSKKPNKTHLGITFSGPLISTITPETRRKIKNHSNDTVLHEPTSPRVSCMGQVICKHKLQKLQLAGNNPPAGKILRLVQDDQKEASKTVNKSKKKSGFKKLFSGITAGAGAGKKKSTVPVYLDKVPSLGTMKRFSSGRDKFSDIDWVKVGEISDSGDRRYDSGEESDGDDVIVPSSAPVVIRNSLGFDGKFDRVVGNMTPRKEINLWKRRTMPQPKPLVLNNN